ncbi:aminoglycoside N(3)-acetyltransferase [Actinacidiphila alni]|uniref:aminoglycoside N(3)-acetyltransferase n=1 Tax=Actinacidiphila alni TaxID=380248 RepID=UPI003455B44A
MTARARWLPGGAHTRSTLAADFERLGVRAGSTVLVHASLRRIGAVRPWREPHAGRAGPDDPVAATVLAALRHVLGPRGTLVVPTFTEGNSSTSRAYRERIAGMTAEQVAGYRASMPPFDPDTSPSQGMGRFAEAVRRAPGAYRSGHPQTSFAALGARAARLAAHHDGNCHLGPDSPLGPLHRDRSPGTLILLIGVGYEVCSAFHLAEYLRPDPPTRDYSCVVRRGGRPQWITYRDVELDDSDFADLGTAYEKADTDRRERRVNSGTVGDADARGLALHHAVDFAAQWLAGNRPRPVESYELRS